MNISVPASLRRCGRFASVFATAAFTLSPLAVAQTQVSETRSSEPKPAEVTQTIFLAHAIAPHDLTDIQLDLRNMLPHVHIYANTSANAISMSGTADEVAQAQKLVGELDRPHQIYRLTYTITSTENGKELAPQRVSFVVLPGQKAILKEGSRVPIVTGGPKSEKEVPSSQVQYLDVGLNIEARLEGSPDDLRLSTKVEQSSVSEERSGIGLQDPVIRQTQLQGDVLLSQNKSLSIGSLDIPGGTRRQEVAVLAELVR